MPADTQEEYIRNNGTLCPNCHHRGLDAKPIISNNPVDATSLVECLACGATWKDRFKLVGYDSLNVP